MPIIKRILIGIVLLFAVAQFFEPEKNQGTAEENAAFITETKPSLEVKSLLEKSCFDCHSNNTDYLWYSNITPINYWMNHHIEEGKEELNFSEWVTYSVERKKHKMEEIYEEVEERHMPISPYLITHSDAKFTEEQIEVIVGWAKNRFEEY